MRKVAVVFSLLVIFSLTAAPALAGLIWCSTDPIVQLPGGGVVQIRVSVQAENQYDPFILTVTAPTGSQLIATGHQINVAYQLLAGANPTQITATSDASFEVRVSARYQGVDLGTFSLSDRKDKAVFDW